MSTDLTGISTVLLSDQGDAFLNVMRDAYFGGRDIAGNYSEERKRQLLSLGLIQQKESHCALTPTGYLVGNVAKEYCNYRDLNGQMPLREAPPDAFLAGKDVLDLGCSFGRWLWMFRRLAKSVTGIEMQEEYIELGKVLCQRERIAVPTIIHGSIEDVDRLVRPASYDFVFARLVFNAVEIKPTLEKAVQALRPGGVLWLRVEGARIPLKRLFGRRERLRTRLYAGFALANTAVLLATGKQVRLRVKGRMHGHHQPAYPSVRWWRKSLKELKLEQITVVERQESVAVLHGRKPCSEQTDR